MWSVSIIGNIYHNQSQKRVFVNFAVCCQKNLADQNVRKMIRRLQVNVKACKGKFLPVVFQDFSDGPSLLLKSMSSGHASVKSCESQNLSIFDDAALQKHARPKDTSILTNMTALQLMSKQSHSVNCKICYNTYL